MPTTKQEKDFSGLMEDSVETTVLPGSLANAILFVGENIDPGDVYKEQTLLAFAKNYDPEDVFSTADLEAWAESNGYVKE